MDVIAFQPPVEVPGWIETLPEPALPRPLPGGILFGIFWFLKTAADLSRIPPRPRKLHFGDEDKERSKVVTIADCRTAVTEVITTREVIGIMSERIIPIIARCIPLVDAWSDLEQLIHEELGKVPPDIWQPLVDEVVYRIADFALSQLAQRHADQQNYNVRQSLRKSRREKGQVIDFEPPRPPGDVPPGLPPHRRPA